MTHTRVVLLLGLAGIIVMGAIKGFELFTLGQAEKVGTDARDTKGRILIGVDSWVGYFPLCSAEMAARLRDDGYLLECVDDKADYGDRYAKLKRGDYSFAVGTVDSFLVAGEKSQYAGAIVAVIDESKGGDAIVARKSRFADLESLKGVSSAAVAFTPDSPSEHLLRAVVSHFDVDALREDNAKQIKTDGAESALESLDGGKADIAVLWEPVLTHALKNPEYVQLLSTAETQRIIVDVLIANLVVAQKQPDLIKMVLKRYFETLSFYRDNPEKLQLALMKEYKLKPAQVEKMIAGVSWKSLAANAREWFGLKREAGQREALVETIRSALDILFDHKVFGRNPLPGQDPYRLLNRMPLENLVNEVGGVESETEKVTFKELTEQQWGSLVSLGALKVRPVSFTLGSSDLTLEGKSVIDELIANLAHYPRFRVEVRGHSGLTGDAAANKQLSQDRADSVLRYIDVTYGLEPHRWRAVGFGSERPLPKKPGESDRGYGYRLPRVEMVLLIDET